MTAGAGGHKTRGGAGAVLRFMILAVLGIIVALGLLIAFPPIKLIKDQLAIDLGRAIGRTVQIEDARIRYDLPPSAKLELIKVSISNPDGMRAGNVLQAGQVDVDVAVLPLLKGRVELLDINLVEPDIRLEEGEGGLRNWVFKPSTETEGTQGPTGGASRISPPPSVSLEEGRVSFVSAKTGAQRAASDVNAVLKRDGVTGKAALSGNMRVNNELTRFELSVADYFAAQDGKSSDIDLSVSAPLLDLKVMGDASFAADAAFTGTVDGTTRSLPDLATWAGLDVAKPETPMKAAIAGKVVATLDTVRFDGTDIAVNQTSSRLDGQLELSGPRPKLSGTLSSAYVDLARVFGIGRAPARAASAQVAPSEEIEVESGWAQLLSDLTALETGTDQSNSGAAGLAPSAAQAAVRSRGGWSDKPISFKALRAVDLDLVVQADDLDYGTLDLASGEIHATLTDGALAADIKKLEMGKGSAKGRVKLNSRASPPVGEVDLQLTDVAAEPIIKQLTGRPLLSGTSNVNIVAKAVGVSQRQLASTLEGKARFQMRKGALRGFDVRAMISQWWRRWKFNLARKTGFERLNAQYDIRKGILRSRPGLDLGGSEVEINSRGDVNVPARRINQEIRVKVVPPPTSWPIPVRISGSWTKPSISVDWGALFSSPSPELNGPQGVQAADEPAPAAVQAAIRRVLASDLPADQLSENGKAMLRSLLPAPVDEPGVAPEDTAVP